MSVWMAELRERVSRRRRVVVRKVRRDPRRGGEERMVVCMRVGAVGSFCGADGSVCSLR